MKQVIIFKNDEGGISVIHPTPEALTIFSVDEIAEKDVPKGKKYLIIDETTLPDRSLRDLWDMDDVGVFVRQ